MLIRNAGIWRGPTADVRLANGRVEAIGQLEPNCAEDMIDARGGLLLPGLHDHHIHLAATAASRASVACGPPGVTDEKGLARALALPGSGWLRGIGYTESVAGEIDRKRLDALCPDRPLRIQHRTGRMWFLNSLAVETLLAPGAAPAGLDRQSGRLFDEDAWMRQALGGAPPDLAPLAEELAMQGVTGFTDMSPANDGETARWMAAQRLPQRLVLAGTLSLAGLPAGISTGPAKLHLHENAFPDFDATADFARAAHEQARGVAVHCTTEAELVYALAVLREAGASPHDRIEHAGVAPDHLVAGIAAMGLQVCSNPGFIANRGDRYLAEVPARDRPHLYRLAAFRDAGVVLAAGSDAPYGPTDPWAAIRAAVDRRTAGGATIGTEEALSPEQALALYLADPLDLARERRIEPGVPADLVLLDRPWVQARTRLRASDVRATFVGGAKIFDCVDQSPIERSARADALAR